MPKPVRDRDFRRDWRFDEAQTHSSVMQPGANLLPRQSAIVGFSNIELTTEAFRQQLTEKVKGFTASPVDPKSVAMVSGSGTVSLNRSGTGVTSIMFRFTAAETVGVEHRGAYYDAAGALRDMVPNHLW
jgi:glucose-6-phosphate 1-dehydrogenase